MRLDLGVNRSHIDNTTPSHEPYTIRNCYVVFAVHLYSVNRPGVGQRCRKILVWVEMFAFQLSCLVCLRYDIDSGGFYEKVLQHSEKTIAYVIPTIFAA